MRAGNQNDEFRISYQQNKVYITFDEKNVKFISLTMFYEHKDITLFGVLG